MGEIDDAEDAENERQPAGDKKEHKAVLNAIQQLNGEGQRIHHDCPGA